MDAATSQPRRKRVRELDEPEQARDAKQRRVKPDAQAPSRTAAQLVAGNSTTTGATALTHQHSTATAAPRAARIPPNGTQAQCPPSTKPSAGVNVDTLAPPSPTTSGGPIAGHPQIKRVRLIVRPPATEPSMLAPPSPVVIAGLPKIKRVNLIVRPPGTAPSSSSGASMAVGPAALDSKRPRAAKANVGGSGAQPMASSGIAKDHEAPASARRPAARAACEGPSYRTTCSRAMAVEAIAGQASGSGAVAEDDGDVTTTDLESDEDGDVTTTEIDSESETD